MNLDGLHYFLELTKDLNMTKTASRLYISTQALSYHIQRLEEYYETPLFYRKPVFELTYAGKLVLRFAQLIERENLDLKHHLSDIKNEEEGEIRLGVGMARGRRLLKSIMEKFSSRFPNVSILCTDRFASDNLTECMSNSLDLAIVVKEKFNPVLQANDFLTEPVYLCIPEKLLSLYFSVDEVKTLKETSWRGVTIEQFIRLPFVQLDNKLGRKIQSILAAKGMLAPPYLLCRYVNQALPLCLLSLTACYAPHMSIVENLEEMIASKINVFPLIDSVNAAPITQELSLVYHKDRYMPNYTKYFMQLLLKTTLQINEVSVIHTV